MERRDFLAGMAAAAALTAAPASAQPTAKLRGRIKQGLWKVNFGADAKLTFDQECQIAARLGLTADAARLVAERALTPPAPGYTWPGFAPAIYDYAPISELYAGMVSAVSWMLLQPGDDARGSMVLLPAWPCEWSVRFKLWGPLNTTVELDYAPGLRRELVVTPASRLRDVAWAGCGP